MVCKNLRHDYRELSGEKGTQQNFRMLRPSDNLDESGWTALR